MKNNKGYSLVEVIVAGVFIAAVVVGIFGVVARGSSINREQMLARRAFEEAERILEYNLYSSGNYLNLPSGQTDSQGSFTLETKSGTTVTATASVYTESVTYTCGGLSLPGKKITVKMIWTDNGKADSVMLSNVVSNANVN